VRAESRSGLLLSAPYVAFLAVFSLYPIGFAVVLVLLQWDLVTTPSFAGLDNLRHLAGDARFFRAIANTFVFLAIHLPLQIVVALALAWALDRPLVLRSFWRAAFFLPVVISGAVVTILWSALYATDVGFINSLLAKLGLGVGFYVVIYLAGLQNVPRSCHEAVELEGATAWQRFWHITLPLLKPQTLLVVTLSTINGFQLFIEPYVMTGGGPLRRTLSIVLYMYKNAFSYQKMGYAATLGLALALIIASVLLVQRRLVGRAEES
jgi:multiple sugar transport system permease protein